MNKPLLYHFYKISAEGKIRQTLHKIENLTNLPNLHNVIVYHKYCNQWAGDDVQKYNNLPEYRDAFYEHTGLTILYQDLNIFGQVPEPLCFFLKSN